MRPDLGECFKTWLRILLSRSDPESWEWLGGTQGRRLYWENIWKSAVDCIYYSFATITTSAYGDIKPTAWYTKLLTNLEVLLGIGLVSIGFGRYFSEKDKA